MPNACVIPGNWPQCVRSALVEVASLAHWAVIYSRSWCADSKLQRVRLASTLEQAETEIALLREEIRIKDSRMEKIPAPNRPHYPPTERLAILELKAVRGWNLVQTARGFLLEPETVASWLHRVDEEGENALVQVSEPINKFPELVRHVVQRLKTLCPVMGKRRIAETLARAGLHLAATTVGRFLKTEPGTTPPQPDKEQGVPDETGRVVTAKRPNHVWHVDLTTVPTAWGFWTGWFPFALPQVWPFCWWVAVVVDHFSRKCLGFAVFLKEPTSVQIRRFLGRVIHVAGTTPRHVISDKGPQFFCKGFKKWCKHRKIKPRYGAVGQYGSIAVIERFIRSLKDEHTRRILIPFRLADFSRDLTVYVDWYNEVRPHRSLDGRTPQDLYSGSSLPMHAFETRGPKAMKLGLVVHHHGGRRHLPVVELREAA